MRSSLLIAIGILVVIWLPLTIWTVRRLWREESGAYGRMVYLFGVRRFGALAWVTMTAVMLVREPSLGTSLWLRGPLLAFVNLPLWLWCGYWWGRAMASVYGLQRSDQ